MKKFKIIVLFTALFLICLSNISAQVHVTVNINSQPQWGPYEYDYVEYYFLPEAGIYYYVPKAQFIFRKGNKWVYAYKLPYKYHYLDLFNTYKVVINEPRPYLRNKYYVSHYKKYKYYHSKQVSHRDSRKARLNKDYHNQGNPGNKMIKKTQKRNMQSQPGAREKKGGHGNMNKKQK